MNDELQLTDAQLRLATSRSLPTDVELTSDTAAARDAFLALGATLESASSNFDKSAFLAQLKKSCLDAPVAVPQRTQVSRDWLSPILITALAAAALIAIVRISADSTTTNPHIASIDSPSPTVTIPSITATPTRSIFAWNDPLDDELALASATIEQFATRRPGFDDSLLDMNDQLKALSQELTNETL